ncbi:hypothetical protein [Shewanella algae]|uniref:hypothetical protein n=1 Tax=Shewanella algae TaxID=38313 RepID=UPI000B314419
MPRPRRTQISLEDTPYYHCCSRVVRRAFLCGDDAYSGNNYDHRRGWVESLLFELKAVFTIDVAEKKWTPSINGAVVSPRLCFV